MDPLSEIYPTDTNVISINALGVSILQSNRPFCVGLTDIAGDGALRVITLDEGTWDGTIFTYERTIAVVSANNGDTGKVTPLRVVTVDKAIRATVT
jgi:hypothetical protein